MRYSHFSPTMLRRFAREGRGTGTGEHYIPWHQVRPHEPASKGRSHLVNGRFNRLHHLLSDQEYVVFALSNMLDLVDAREQYPLSLEPRGPELACYQMLHDMSLQPGTLAVASDLGIRHPMARGDGEQMPWIMTTDLVLTLGERGRRSLLAIAVKLLSDLRDRRTRALLRIEREYWRRQDVPWLLITPEDMIHPESFRTMQGCLQWVLPDWDVADPCWVQAAEIRQWADSVNGSRLGEALASLSHVTRLSMEQCQCVFWRRVWNGLLPLDLSVPLRPASKLRILDDDAFRAQNPVAMRRTAWQG